MRLSMSEQTSPIRNISDTALWAAAYRARESERRNALFHDPFAARLAGERGQRSVESMRASTKHTWAWITRTYLFDEFIKDCVNRDADLVINLAAGLDARPYRMDLPPMLRWIEVDLPDLIAYKEQILSRDRPRCRLERVALNLADADARRELLDRLGEECRRGLVITEGLIIYFAAEEVAALAGDLARTPGLRNWAFDLASPALLKILQESIGAPLGQAGAPLKFGPPEGPRFFAAHGWNPTDVRSMLHTAARLKRLPFPMRLFAWFPDSKGLKPSRPWSGVCLASKT